MTKTSFAKILQGFFLQRLINQKNASRQTIFAYRDTFRLLFNFLKEQTHKEPSDLTLNDLDVQIILKFLEHLETTRSNSIATRNARLAAIRSFFRYASFLAPECMEVIQKILSIPKKRSDRSQVNFLSRDEIEALINAPDLSTWTGNRDHTMFMTLYNTGARVSEITKLQIQDIDANKNACVKIQGKGRKERVLPLWNRTACLIKKWINHLNPSSNDFLFPNAQGEQLTRYGVGYRIQLAKKAAINKCPSLKGKQISPHTFRHTTAVHLLQSGVDVNVIALWLGHESPSTTHIYLQADLAMKKRILQKLESPSVKNVVYQPNDSLLSFLEKL